MYTKDCGSQATASEGRDQGRRRWYLSWVEEFARLIRERRTFLGGRTACAKTQRLKCALSRVGIINCPVWLEPERGGVIVGREAGREEKKLGFDSRSSGEP